MGSPLQQLPPVPLFSICRFVIFLFFSVNNPIPSSADLHRTKVLTAERVSDSTVPRQAEPTTFFEVTNPIILPNTTPCKRLVLEHTFANTYGQPPVLASYSPPSNCPSHSFAKIVLEWKSACRGRQFDRIFGVWVGGVELLRSCTAEPRPTGIVWSVEKDVTRYHSLLMKGNQTLAAYMGNVVDNTYTGVYHANITFWFYPFEDHSGDFVSGRDRFADLILPISRALPLKDGLWFEIQNSTDSKSAILEIPQNAHRAVLEVYVSFHENDEFWYSNALNDYIAANNLTGTPGNGPFREVLVWLDNAVAGAVWPFTVVYTGGINPLFWRPITGIASFDLPSYDIEITPFLGQLLDGKPHKFAFTVTNALNVWYIDANLHLWIDAKSPKTAGKLVEHTSPLPLASMKSDFQGLNGTFLTSVRRNLSVAGWVKSSHGNVTTKAIQEFSFTNVMEVGDDGSSQVVNQIIEFNDTVIRGTRTPSSSSSAETARSLKRFRLYLNSSESDRGNDTGLSVSNITLGFHERKVKGDGLKWRRSSLNNSQSAHGYMLVKGRLVMDGLGSTQQVYEYERPGYRFFRNVSSCNSTVIYDKTDQNSLPNTRLNLPELCRSFRL